MWMRSKRPCTGTGKSTSGSRWDRATDRHKHSLVPRIPIGSAEPLGKDGAGARGQRSTNQARGLRQITTFVISRLKAITKVSTRNLQPFSVSRIKAYIMGATSLEFAFQK